MENQYKLKSRTLKSRYGLWESLIYFVEYFQACLLPCRKCISTLTEFVAIELEEDEEKFVAVLTDAR